MFDFIDWFIENRNKPLGYIILAAFVFLIDRFGRKLITDQVKRLFHVGDKENFKEYAKNQQEIKQMLLLMMQKEGITWHAPTSTLSSETTVTTKRKLFSRLWMDISPVRAAKQYINYWRFKMTNINKGILLPLMSAIAYFIKQAFGYEIPDETVNTYTEGVLLLLAFVGIFIKPKKEKVEEFYH